MYILILTLATAGLPIAVSKFVAERAILGHFSEARRVLKLAMGVLFILGVLFFGLLIRPLAAIFIMCGVLGVSIECLDWILNYSAIIYFIVLLRTGSVTKEDLAHVPGFESKLQPFLEKLHLL